MKNNKISNITKVKKQVKVLKSPAHPYRLRIINTLRDGKHRVCDIEAHLGLQQAYCSQLLAVPRKAGLVQDRQEGHNVFYHVSGARVFDVLDTVEEMAGK